MGKALTILAATAVLAVVVAPPASAQLVTRPVDKSTLLTFSGPVSLPNVTLPAGTYLFKFVDPIDAPGVLEVMSKDGETSYALINTIPIHRIETESNNSEVVTFRETPDESSSIDAWFFDAGDTSLGSQDVGCELVHSK